MFPFSLLKSWEDCLFCGSGGEMLFRFVFVPIKRCSLSSFVFIQNCKRWEGGWFWSYFFRVIFFWWGEVLSPGSRVQSPVYTVQSRFTMCPKDGMTSRQGNTTNQQDNRTSRQDDTTRRQDNKLVGKMTQQIGKTMEQVDNRDDTTNQQDDRKSRQDHMSNRQDDRTSRQVGSISAVSRVWSLILPEERRLDTWPVGLVCDVVAKLIIFIRLRYHWRWNRFPIFLFIWVKIASSAPLSTQMTFEIVFSVHFHTLWKRFFGTFLYTPTCS